MTQNIKSNQIQFYIKKDDNKIVSEGSATINKWSKQQALTKATKTMLLFFAMAIVTLFIPIIHYIAVPFFLIAGPLFAFGYIYPSFNGKTDVNFVDEFNCKKCSNNISLPSPIENYPARLFCNECKEQYTIALT